jgi:hypothetical protein
MSRHADGSIPPEVLRKLRWTDLLMFDFSRKLLQTKGELKCSPLPVPRF